MKDLSIEQKPLNLYGSLEGMVQEIREYRPLDLNAEVWHKANPGRSFSEWRATARKCVLDGFHYDPQALNLSPETLNREERDGLIIEHVCFNTTPWNRLNGYLLMPQGVAGAMPALVVCHAWGGPMIFGKERIVNTGQDHPILEEHRAIYYSGNYLAEEFARAGFVVVVIDAHHFGERAPRGIGGIPNEYDPFKLSLERAVGMHQLTVKLGYTGFKQLVWAGTTWMGLNFWDDSRCIDYLLTRPEVDPERIGVTGLSGGGWRTNMLAALDDRVKASVSVGWMTTGDYQQIYNVQGAVGYFCLLPGVWNRLDVPDLAVMSAPSANMIVLGTEDPLFPAEAKAEAARQIQAGYDWAGCPDKFRYFNPSTDHCYNAEIQEEAIAWFKQHLLLV